IAPRLVGVVVRFVSGTPSKFSDVVDETAASNAACVSYTIVAARDEVAAEVARTPATRSRAIFISPPTLEIFTSFSILNATSWSHWDHNARRLGIQKRL